MAQTVKNLPAVQETGLIPGSAKILWRREWLSTQVFFPGESHEQRSRANYSPYGCKELNTIELNWSKYSVQIYSMCPQLLIPYLLISGVTKVLSDLHLCAVSRRYPRGLPFPFQSWSYFQNHFLLLWPGRFLSTFWGSDLFSPRNILISRPGECQKPYEGTGHNVHFI